MNDNKPKTNDPYNKQIEHKALASILKMVEADVAPFMVGPSGSGKTSIARRVAEKLNLDFYFTGSIESAFQVKGFMDANGNLVRTPFRDAYEKGGLFLFDELDASDSQAIVSLHAALDNGVLDAPDGIIEKHPDFRYLAAGNTWGHGASLQYMGRNALDGATLDRYAIVEVDYDPQFEKELVKKLVGESFLSWVSVVHQARQVVYDLQMRHIVSTRAAVNGAKLLKAGFEHSEAFNRVVLKGMDQDLKVQFMKKMDEKIREIKDVEPSGMLERLNLQLEELQDLVEDATVKTEEITQARKKMLWVNRELDKAATSRTALTKLTRQIDDMVERIEKELPATAEQAETKTDVKKPARRPDM